MLNYLLMDITEEEVQMMMYAVLLIERAEMDARISAAEDYIDNLRKKIDIERAIFEAKQQATMKELKVRSVPESNCARMDMDSVSIIGSDLWKHIMNTK